MKKVPMRFVMKNVKSKPITKHKDDRKQDVEIWAANPQGTKSEMENKEEINDKVMDTKEKIELVNALLDNDAPIKAKRIRKDKSLIERTEGSTIILTEENKELLHD